MEKKVGVEREMESLAGVNSHGLGNQSFEEKIILTQTYPPITIASATLSASYFISFMQNETREDPCWLSQMTPWARFNVPTSPQGETKEGQKKCFYEMIEEGETATLEAFHHPSRSGLQLKRATRIQKDISSVIVRSHLTI